MNYRFFIGIDVSKEYLDAGLLDSDHSSTVQHLKVPNDDPGIALLLSWLNGQDGFTLEQSLFCLEHTGMYNFALLQFFSRYAVDVWVENPIQIKRSLGLQRGKNDKVDALRIAQYAFRMQDRVKLWTPVRKVTDKLRHLASLRERLVETKKKLLTPVEELSKVGDKEMAKVLSLAMNKTIKGLDQDLQKVEKQMKDIIDKDDDLRRLYVLVSSVAGIGFVTTVNIIIATGEFRLFTTYRKFACYAGVAPFEYKSGSSIKGRTKVSMLANKKIKCNLHMASLSAIRVDPSIKAYYNRKVAEGKNKMSVLNAVRNKLLARIFAVVERGTQYQKNYLAAS
jgi:transposase